MVQNLENYLVAANACSQLAWFSIKTKDVIIKPSHGGEVPSISMKSCHYDLTVFHIASTLWGQQRV